ncbi:squalene--hopene cyclase [Brevibacillus porteri]|uniref:Squalene--hopene cyclase n=1 Tax=Brevibacillus porteri TaxID=2126350 RepID=A0ABX5FKD0_9BACL|nr:squalene--hopene cyclase [Brevibacillus porteri]MED1802545.1 squalene--hopene cyclase [Brevibacillus porteri]MED2134191.1 squalene--hopene cyclase [Brevibacillus porteri]MED2745970.1 squalene--hopene cyclase [Brevibacillus porteri]MED2813972.1 squalene--hopene cyclase [Brevibacillus porteri]MED2894160.1 squalene--hopene cyclase [Brevibacillus porteri]
MRIGTTTNPSMLFPLSSLGDVFYREVNELREVQQEINRIQAFLLQRQQADGTWRFCLESSPMTDSHMIILLRTLGIHDEHLMEKLTAHITSLQHDNGAWKLYPDEHEGNLSTTIDSYYALLLSGKYTKDEPRMALARSFILEKGGLTHANMLTKFSTALTGQYQWPSHFLVPVEIALFLPSFPVSFYDFVGYARVHLAPMMIVADRKYAKKPDNAPDLSDLYADTPISRGLYPHRFLENFLKEGQSFLASIHDSLQRLPFLPGQLHKLALRRLEQYILARIEPDGTLYNYSTSTFFMIFALLARGFSPKDPLIQKAMQGLSDSVYVYENGAHLQLATSAVWDTALLTSSLQKSGLSTTHPAIQKANRYLLQKQQHTYGDWKIRNPKGKPGGWGFSDYNTMNPDIDDTTAALRSLRLLSRTDITTAAAWKRGLEWLLSMQNDDGGWPAFERNTDADFIRQLPIEGADTVSTDPSSADLTGRTLEFLGNYAGRTLTDPHVEKGVRWLLNHQEANGSWYGRWGIAYLYGTWAAITGLMAVGFSPTDPAIQKAVAWLVANQNPDGGWGESCQSDQKKTYVPLGASTPSQTAWATDALIAVSSKPTAELQRGIRHLLTHNQANDWTTRYPTGGGRPGGTYFAYHSYRWIWPLLALSHYQAKYANT